MSKYYKFQYNIKTISIIIMVILCMLANCTLVYADELNEAISGSTLGNNVANVPTVLSKYAVLMDCKTGQILYEKSSHEKTFPASTTKLMTAILTVENCKLDDEVTISKEALLGIPKSYTTAALQAGEKLSVNELLQVLLIPSANDAANALACHISGSVENFAIKMNEKAKEIGCLNTNFVNPNGVHNDAHVSTAYDMALIGKYATKFDVIKNIATQTSCTLPNLPDGKTRIFKTTNNLINNKNKYYYENATGLKTGYTDKAKSCIVATATKDNKDLLCVILGGNKTEDQKPERELDCKALFEYGFNNFYYANCCTAKETVDVSKVNDMPLNIKMPIYLMLIL